MAFIGFTILYNEHGGTLVFERRNIFEKKLQQLSLSSMHSWHTGSQFAFLLELLFNVFIIPNFRIVLAMNAKECRKWHRHNVFY